MSKIDTIKTQLLIKYPVFANVIVNADYKESYEVNSAATDGKTIYYNPLYLETISSSQQLFLLAHEVCHIAFRHITRQSNKNIKVWNTATDAIINQLLLEDGLEPVPNAIIIKDALDYDAESLYEKLLKENTPTQEGHDSHKMWHETESKEETKISEKNFIKDNNTLKKERLIQYKEELNNAILESNKIVINDSVTSNSSIPWRSYLRENQMKNWDWTYRNATIEYGIITPTIEEIRTPETEVLLDTSGSISREQLKRFLAECRDLLRFSQVKIGCFDKKFYGFHTIRTQQDLENMPLVGGGGTSFTTALSSFSKRADNKIIFTDGLAPMPDIWMNVLWIVLGDKIYPKGGKVVYLQEKELSKENNRIKVKK